MVFQNFQNWFIWNFNLKKIFNIILMNFFESIKFNLNQIRKVNIDDLLGRDPINLEVEAVKRELKDKVVLITGAAGSIGSGIARQILNYQPSKIILLDQWESGLYDLQIDLIAQENDGNVEVVIGDVRDFIRMKRLFMALKPDIVFHAAAYKHV